MDGLTLFGTWLAALLTLCILSFLYKDNPFYKFAEYLFVGVSAGYIFALQFHNVIKPNLITPLFGYGKLGQPDYDPGAFANIISGLWDWRVLYLLAAVLGVTMLFRFFPKVAWVSRYGIAFAVGLGAGFSFITRLQSDCLAQLRATVLAPVVITAGGGGRRRGDGNEHLAHCRRDFRFNLFLFLERT